VDALIQDHLPALQVVVLLLGVPMAAALRARHLAWLTATCVSAVAFAVAVQLTVAVTVHGAVHYDVGGWPPPYGIELRVDAFSAMLLLIVTGASSIVLLAARAVIHTEIGAAREPLFYAAWLLVTAGLVGMTVSGDAFNVFVFLEISSLATYVLIAAGRDRRALPAVFNYLVLGTIGGSCYLIGVGLLYMMTGTLNFADLAQRVGDVAGSRPLMLAAGFITIGLALKAAIFPLHLWLPDAYSRAPDIVTAFLAACSTKVALYLLIRFDFLVLHRALPEHAIGFAAFLMPIGVLAMLMASVFAVFQRDLKRMLAFSTIAQVGYIVLGASLLSVSGLSAAIIHLFNHAWIKGTLFLAVACLGVRLADTSISSLSGIARQMPWTMAAFTAAAFSLIGVPGTAGFISKWLLITAVLDAGALGVLLIAAIVSSSLLAVLYVWRVIEHAYFMPRAAGAVVVREAPGWMLFMTWACVAGNIYFGIQPAFPLALARAAALILVGDAP
jgi:multicomponent Na+:H+ antiporter subunit D